MKKEKLNFLVQVIIFLAGFLPWMKFEGKYCSVINVLIKGFSGEFGAGGIGNPLFLWAFFLLISYSVYPILCYRIWKQKDWEKTESVAFYLGTIGFIAFQTVFGICLLVVDKEIDFVPFQFLRSAVIVIWYFVNRYLYDLPNEKTVRFRMKKRKTRPDAWWFYIITSVISVISILFAKWVCIGKYSYTVIGFLTKSAQNGGFLKFLEKITGNSLSGNMEAYGMISVSFYLLYLLLVIVILSIIRCILFL